MMLRTTPSRFCSSAARSLRASRRVIAVTITGHAVNGGKTAHPRSISTSTTTRSKHGAVNTSISSSDAHKERYSGQWSKKPFWATAALSTGLVLSTLLTQPLVAEEDNSKKDEANNVSKAAFTKDQIGVICIIGESASLISIIDLLFFLDDANNLGLMHGYRRSILRQNYTIRKCSK